MIQLFAATFLVSLLHALIPSHWIPLLSISRTYKWSRNETLRMSFFLSCAHILSSLLIGLFLGFLGLSLQDRLENSFQSISSGLLVIFGLYFLYRHHTHHHFHVDDELLEPPVRKRQLFLSLMMFMILSPCMEITGFFFKSAAFGTWALLGTGVIYTITSMVSMIAWVYFLYYGFQKINAHQWEHRSGILTGITIILTGILSFFIN